MRKSLRADRHALGGRSVRDLRRVRRGHASRGWHDAQINRDRNLRLQYLAGRGLNLYHADTIYAEMLPNAKDPQGIFTGSEDLKQELLQKIHSAWNR